MAGLRGLEGMPVLLTGGASGIGRAIALRLGEEGARVGVVDRDGKGGDETAGRIRAAGGSASAFAVDITGKLAAALARAIPMRRLATPDDFPGIVALLLSDDAAFITGQTISVSGGLTMHG